MSIHDDRTTLLGEGPLWHPERHELWWCDILGRRVHGPGRSHATTDMPSAMGWIDRGTVLLAQRGALLTLDLDSGATDHVAPLDADRPDLRSNDGRADPWGGFWVGTMGIEAEPRAGNYWRYYRGETRRLWGGVGIPNATCFHPSGFAVWCDTQMGIAWRQDLDDAHGWPKGDPTPFVDLSGQGRNIDGAVFDAEGTLWAAMWGEGAVVGFREGGREVGRFEFPARQTSCPALGGEGLSTLFCTSASIGLAQPLAAREPDQGRTFALPTGLKGLPEHRVIL